MRQSRTRKKIPRGMSSSSGGSYDQEMVLCGAGANEIEGCVDCHDYYEIHV